MSIVYAIALGTLFGFVLQRVGAADPQQIVDMLRLRDLRLAKAIMSGIGIASVLTFLSGYVGLLDMGHLSVKGMYWGVPIGGLLLGFGWALSGYCPGTGVVGAGAGRKDGLFFIAGGLLGAGLYTLIYGTIADAWFMQDVFGGKASIVSIPGAAPMFDQPWSLLVAVAIGAVFVLLAKVVPERLS